MILQQGDVFGCDISRQYIYTQQIITTRSNSDDATDVLFLQRVYKETCVQGKRFVDVSALQSK